MLLPQPHAYQLNVRPDRLQLCHVRNHLSKKRSCKTQSRCPCWKFFPSSISLVQQQSSRAALLMLA